jgi:hypothetical protein
MAGVFNLYIDTRGILNPVKFLELGELTRIATIQGTGVFLILRACRLHLYSELLRHGREANRTYYSILGGTSRKLHKREIVLTKLLRRLITIVSILPVRYH